MSKAFQKINFRSLPYRDLERIGYYFAVDLITVALSWCLTQEYTILVGLQQIQHIYYVLNWNKSHMAKRGKIFIVLLSVIIFVTVSCILELTRLVCKRRQIKMVRVGRYCLWYYGTHANGLRFISLCGKSIYFIIHFSETLVKKLIFFIFKPFLNILNLGRFVDQYRHRNWPSDIHCKIVYLFTQNCLGLTKWHSKLGWKTVHC